MTRPETKQAEILPWSVSLLGASCSFFTFLSWISFILFSFTFFWWAFNAWMTFSDCSNSLQRLLRINKKFSVYWGQVLWGCKFTKRTINFLMLLILECILERLPFLLFKSNCLSYLATVTQLGSLSCVLEKENSLWQSLSDPEMEMVWPSCPSCCKNAWFQLENNYSYPPQEEQLEIPRGRGVKSYKL